MNILITIVIIIIIIFFINNLSQIQSSAAKPAAEDFCRLGKSSCIHEYNNIPSSYPNVREWVNVGFLVFILYATRFL